MEQGQEGEGREGLQLTQRNMDGITQRARAVACLGERNNSKIQTIGQKENVIHTAEC